ncbi:hypothetical protein TNCT_1141 [Trichonephila clavata]|uniref:Uncharacterized protein n=1 Tax=Trichonephila clavata TaxID=2740835 RepID=A0A8X6HTZ8_TRICU|nr:hypothetical protein TNCT_1141 [Trichonephila clavata]
MPNDDQRSKYPCVIALILLIDFSENFCFSSYSTILKDFLNQKLKVDESQGVSILRNFKILSYFTPLLGGIIADMWLGCFWTIFFASILHALGNSLVTLSSLMLSWKFVKFSTLFGLFTFAIGTGGLQPCILSLGGDQFQNNQVRGSRIFFSMIYIVGNAGIIASLLFVPKLNNNFDCMGEKKCFSLPFGFCTLVFLLAFIIFIYGKPWYKIHRATGRTIELFIKCIVYALFKSITNAGEKKNHWLDHADDKYDEALILDIKSFIGIIWIYLPLPFFWTLYEKQSSVWMQQAKKMDSEELQPPPVFIQMVNLVLVAILIPVFDCIIYPCLSKFGLCRTDLQKMTVGGCLSAIAFIMAGFTQMYIESTKYSGFQNLGDIVVINNCPCEIVGEDEKTYSMQNFHASFHAGSFSRKREEWYIKPTNCGSFNRPETFTIKMVTLWSTSQYEGEEIVSNRSSDNKASVTLHFNTSYLKKVLNFDFYYIKTIHIVPSKELSRPYKVSWVDYNPIPPSMRHLFFTLNENEDNEQSKKCEKIPEGATYIAAYHQNSDKCHGIFSSFFLNHKLQLSILYQLPQIVFLSCGEVMFSVTGLKFTYSQAPSSLKSVVQAIWLVTNGVGNVLVIILDEVMNIPDQSNQYFVYAAIMFMSIMVFACLGHLYIYVDRE